MINLEYDFNRFLLKADEIADEIITDITKEVQEHSSKKKTRRPYIAAYEISKRALVIFKNRMKEQFPYQEYSNFRKLALLSKENQFLLEFRTKLEKIFEIAEPNQSKS